MTLDMKLFVWPHVLKDYTDGLAVAAARDVLEARKIILGQDAGCTRDEIKIYRDELAADLMADPEVFDLPAGYWCPGGS